MTTTSRLCVASLPGSWNASGSATEFGEAFRPHPSFFPFPFTRELGHLLCVIGTSSREPDGVVDAFATAAFTETAVPGDSFARMTIRIRILDQIRDDVAHLQRRGALLLGREGILCTTLRSPRYPISAPRAWTPFPPLGTICGISRADCAGGAPQDLPHAHDCCGEQ